MYILHASSRYCLVFFLHYTLLRWILPFEFRQSVCMKRNSYVDLFMCIHIRASAFIPPNKRLLIAMVITMHTSSVGKQTLHGFFFFRDDVACYHQHMTWLVMNCKLKETSWRNPWHPNYKNRACTKTDENSLSPIPCTRVFFFEGESRKFRDLLRREMMNV